jgi:hypothetical protein
MHPILPGPDAARPLQSNPQTIESLKAARQRMLDAAGSLGQSAKKVATDSILIAATRAQFAICDVFRRSPNAARVRARAHRTLRKTVPAYTQFMQRYEPFSAAASMRLTAALQLLHSGGISFNGTGGAPYPLAERQARAVRLLGICRAVERCNARMNRLGDSYVTLRVLMNAHNPKMPSAELSRRILAQVKDAGDILREISSELGPIAYPFAHATEGISIANVVVPKFPADRNPAQAMSCSVAALGSYSNIVIRTLAELAQIAEDVETAIGLEPLADLETPDKPAAPTDRPANVRKYWINYSARAAAGIALFTFLFWISINPPVLPAGLWDKDESPGGYQPNSFVIPFARSPQYFPQYTPPPAHDAPTAQPINPTIPQFVQPNAPAVPNFPQPARPNIPSFPQPARPQTPFTPAIPHQIPPVTPPQIPAFHPPPMPQPFVPARSPSPAGAGGRGG